MVSGLYSITRSTISATRPPELVQDLGRGELALDAAIDHHEPTVVLPGVDDEPIGDQHLQGLGGVGVGAVVLGDRNGTHRSVLIGLGAGHGQHVPAVLAGPRRFQAGA